MSKEVDKLVRKGPHPTLNPFMDDMLEMNQDGSLQKTIQKLNFPKKIQTFLLVI